MTTRPSKELETFDNPEPGRNYIIRLDIPEFTCLCPLTGQPDFAVLALEYIADRRCVELKSLKLYLWTFREEGAFHEAVTNRIAGDLAALLEPRWLRLTAAFRARGGISATIAAEHRRDGWEPVSALPPAPLP